MIRQGIAKSRVTVCDMRAGARVSVTSGESCYTGAGG
jgi:hypothetical protein